MRKVELRAGLLQLEDTRRVGVVRHRSRASPKQVGDKASTLLLSHGWPAAWCGRGSARATGESAFDLCDERPTRGRAYLPNMAGLSNLRPAVRLVVPREGFLRDVRAWEGMYIYGHPPSKAVALIPCTTLCRISTPFPLSPPLPNRGCYTTYIYPPRQSHPPAPCTTTPHSPL